MNLQQKIWIRIVSILKASGPLLLYMLLPALLLAIGKAIRKTGQTSEEFAAASGNFYTALAIILVIFLLYRSCKKRGVSFFEEITLSFDKKDWKKMILMFVFGSCAAIGISAIITLIPLPDFLIDDYSEYSQEMYLGTDLVLVILSQVLLAPVAEEIIFRGYMLNRLLPVFSERTAIIIVTVVFALSHVSGIWVLYALLMGYILTKISILEDNILYAIIMHSGFNFPSIINYFIMQNKEATQVLFGNKFIIGIYGIIGILCAFMLAKFYYQKENEIC